MESCGKEDENLSRTHFAGAHILVTGRQLPTYTGGGDGMGCRRNRCPKKGPGSLLPLVCAAFGAGVFLALFCSLKLVLVLAAAFLVVLGLLAADR